MSLMVLKKKNIVIGAIAVVVCALILGYTTLANAFYVVYVDGNPVGYVESEEAANQLLAQVEDFHHSQAADNWQIAVAGAAIEAEDAEGPVVESLDEEGSEQSSADNPSQNVLQYQVTNEVTVEKTNKKPEVPPLDIASVGDMFDYTVKAAVIQVDGQDVVGVVGKDIAEEVIDVIVNGFTAQQDNTQIESFNLLEDVQVVEKMIDPGQVVDREKALNLLASGYDVTREHIVSRGDSLWDIALKNDITVDDLKLANPTIKGNLIQPGQALTLQVPEPYLHVETTETVTETKFHSFKTETIKDSNMYVWESKTITPGIRGRSEVTYEITKINGQEQSRKKLSEEKLSDPQTQVIAKGTKMPSKTGTGTFGWPVWDRNGGTITSYYGWRRSGFHRGLDIAAPLGTPIHAADGGTVVSAGYYGTYGRMIKIDHGNGYSTLYAHNSKLLVNVGKTVNKGDKIALMGNTGRSTGPHVHFEIRKNDQQKNPLSYFNR